ncbi:MAG: class I SAM-dependent methyltransferase [Methylohalobius sp.]|nr:class I SAM-dependent methyltransferase [Methylohalobius sp.]
MTKFLVDYYDLPFLAKNEWGEETHPDWFNWRCEVLLTRNREAIEGKNILDLGSHVGGLMYGCLKLGARHVTGVEGTGRIRLADYYLSQLGYGPQHYTLVQDDVYNHLHRTQPGDYDTVLCCGFLYHTARQLELFKEFQRIAPKHLVIDTIVWHTLTERRSWSTWFKDFLAWRRPAEPPALLFKPERNIIEEKAIGPLGLIAVPTSKWVEWMFERHGFKYRQLLWDKKVIKHVPIQALLGGYLSGRRVSYLAWRSEA